MSSGIVHGQGVGYDLLITEARIESENAGRRQVVERAPAKTQTLVQTAGRPHERGGMQCESPCPLLSGTLHAPQTKGATITMPSSRGRDCQCSKPGKAEGPPHSLTRRLRVVGDRADGAPSCLDQRNVRLVVSAREGARIPQIGIEDMSGQDLAILRESISDESRRGVEFRTPGKAYDRFSAGHQVSSLAVPEGLLGDFTLFAAKPARLA